MGQIIGNPTNSSPTAPPLTPINEKEKLLYLNQSERRIEFLIRLIICTQTPYIQCSGTEVAILAQQIGNGNKHSNFNNGKNGFQILFDRCCAVCAIEGESVDAVIPDVLEFAYDYKNLPLVFDGAFTLKFGKMAQIRPRMTAVEHGMEYTVVFHLKDPREMSRTANLESVRDDFKIL